MTAKKIEKPEHEAKPEALAYADDRNAFSVGESGAHAEFILHDPHAIPRLSFGSRVLIRDRRERKKVWYDGSVVGLTNLAPFHPDRETILYSDAGLPEWRQTLDELDGPHRIQPLTIRVDLHQEITRLQPSGKLRFAPVQRPPTVASRLVFPKIMSPDPDGDPTLQEMLRIRSDGLALGALGSATKPFQDDKEFLIYRLGELENRHMFVVGESGSGKTVFLKQLALEFRRQEPDARILFTDVQGDVAMIMLGDTFKPPTLRGGWPKKIDRPSTKDALKDLGEKHLVFPMTGDALDPKYSRMLEVAKENGVTVHQIGLRMQDVEQPSDVEFLFRSTSLQVAGLLDALKEEISGPATLDAFRREIDARKGGNNNSITVGTTTYHPGTVPAAERALDALGTYFDNHSASMQKGSTNPLAVLKNKGTTVFYLEHLPYEARIMWELQMVRWLYHHKNDEDGQRFVFLDEAHQIVPKSQGVFGSSAVQARARKHFEDLAREGRKYGIHLILSTQAPEDLHPIVPAQCPTSVVMKIQERNASSAGLDKSLARLAARFTYGQFFLRSPFNDTPEWVIVHSWPSNLPHQPLTKFWKTIEGAYDRKTSSK